MSKIDIEVNESLVGAVLGPAGRSIVEIQQYSGAAIQISKKVFDYDKMVKTLNNLVNL